MLTGKFGDITTGDNFMLYRLGVDIGTTYTAAAVQRADGLLEVVQLGTRSSAVPSVLFIGDDGEILYGEAAERRAVSEPGRVVRHVKRRMGDDTPLVVGDAVHTAHDLIARMISWVVEQVAEQRGGPAEALAVTHPAGWGAHKLELLCAALHDQGLGEAVLITEPEAAGISYAGTNQLRPGTALAVYDFGGGTCDTAVLRAQASGRFELVGRPLGVTNVGGIDFDDALLVHVLADFADVVAQLDLTDPATAAAIARLRRECVAAKETLTTDTSATIPVELGDVATKVRITRAEFETMISPAIEGTVGMLAEAIEGAGLEPGELRGVLLTGGSSRIPLVTAQISQDLELRVDMDVDPKLAVAIGAAISLSGLLGAVPAASDAGAPSDVAPEQDDGLAAVVPVAPVPVAADADVAVADDADVPAAADTDVPALIPAARSGELEAAISLPKAAPARPPARAVSLFEGAPARRRRLTARRSVALLGLTAAIALGAEAGVAALNQDDEVAVQQRPQVTQGGEHGWAIRAVPAADAGAQDASGAPEGETTDPTPAPAPAPDAQSEPAPAPPAPAAPEPDLDPDSAVGEQPRGSSADEDRDGGEKKKRRAKNNDSGDDEVQRDSTAGGETTGGGPTDGGTPSGGTPSGEPAGSGTTSGGSTGGEAGDTGSSADGSTGDSGEGAPSPSSTPPSTPSSTADPDLPG